MLDLHNSSLVIHKKSTKYSCFSFTFFLIIPLLLLLLSLTSCDSTTKPKTGSLSGNIVLVNDTDDPSLDPLDFSGITVALYSLATLDTTLSRINREYPHIGVQISQETEFDHRLLNPVAVVQTDESGVFSFEAIPLGVYNIVIFKENWSIRYIYNQEVLNDDKIPTLDDFEVTLYPLVHMPQVVTEQFTFLENRTYMFVSDTEIIGDVTIEGCVRLLLTENTTLRFHSNVHKEENTSFSFISSFNFSYSTSLSDRLERYQSLYFSDNSTVNISGLLIENSTDGVFNRANDSVIRHTIIRNMINGMSCYGDASSISNCIISQCENKGVIVYGKAILSNSIIYGNYDAFFTVEAESHVLNNYFAFNYIGLRPFYGVNIIHNNCFDQNINAIAPCASDPEIYLNNFYQNRRDIELNGYYVQGYVEYCNPSVDNNNFMGNGWYFNIKGLNSVYGEDRYFTGINRDQDFKLNFYVNQDLTEHIYDGNHPQGHNLRYIINTDPRRYRKIAEAGI